MSRPVVVAEGFTPAPSFARARVEVGVARGLQVEVFDRAELVSLGCGGLLGVSAGSSQEPRMVKLRYEPAGGAAGPALGRRWGWPARECGHGAPAASPAVPG